MGLTILPRSFGLRSWFLLLLACIACIAVFFLHFESRVERLDNGEKILVRAVAQISGEMQRGRVEPSMDNKKNDLVVIYNRVPKTGSTSFVGVAYDLCKRNRFHVLHARFVNNISNWNSVKPAFYHGHLAYVEFSKFGSTVQPIYINLIRRPLDRLVSYYYFLRNGDDFRPHLVRRKHGDKMTFDDCVEKQLADCDPENMWLQIPFFCGNKSHLRRTSQKLDPSIATIHTIEQSQVWKMENEFYEFALAQFRFALRKIQMSGAQGVQQTFFYEKIRPK
ncbi:hypothetical protein B566_EDAN011384 [Ephemera danica]|nr:hypothetical protein B566_EDAN011384 [Ephemera danica]